MKIEVEDEVKHRFRKWPLRPCLSLKLSEFLNFFFLILSEFFLKKIKKCINREPPRPRTVLKFLNNRLLFHRFCYPFLHKTWDPTP